jgi:hypothetical protein
MFAGESSEQDVQVIYWHGKYMEIHFYLYCGAGDRESDYIPVTYRG